MKINFDFDFSQLSQESKDEIIIAISEEKLPLGKLFELAEGNPSDQAVFKNWYEERLEDISDAHPMGPLAASAIRKAVTMIMKMGGKK